MEPILIGILKHLIPAARRRALRSAWWHFRNNRKRLRATLRNVRGRSLLDVLGYLESFDCAGRSEVDLWLRGFDQPIRLRADSSDFAVFRQVFLDEQYLLPRTAPIEYVIDAGANVGLTSAYLLQRFPQAKIIAIEPDIRNYRVAEHNLRRFGERVHLVHAGLWPTAGELSVSRGTFADGREWATQTLPVTSESTETVPARTIAQLIEEFHFPRIDLLKVDIEGAELPIFRDGDLSFLDRTELCMVECHGAECSAVFQAAAAAAGFELHTSGELTIATRRNSAHSRDCGRQSALCP